MFRRTRTGTVDIISGSVALNRESADYLTNAMEQCFGDGPARIVLDMGEIPLIDSLGLETMLTVHESIESRAVSLRLAAPNPLCQDILAVTGVGNQFEIFRDVKSAVGSYAV